MARSCTICQHKRRGTIDRALVAGKTAYELAAKFRVSEDALARHRADHLPALLVQAHGAELQAEADALLDQLRDLSDQLQDALDRAEEKDDFAAMASLAKQVLGALKLLAEIEGRIDRRPVVNVLISAEWVELRGVLLAALQPYPDARAAVATALLEVDADARR